jgi:hypothetical protein
MRVRKASRRRNISRDDRSGVEDMLHDPISTRERLEFAGPPTIYRGGRPASIVRGLANEPH